MEAVLERRLRPIYDALDIGNVKKAVQEADKVLKKSPNLQCARALKALALLRLGREEEFEQILGALEKEKIVEDSTLQVMTFVYKETEQFQKICKMYQEAVEQVPGNEEIVSHLFMSHVRLNNFKAQQNVALQLYKINPKNPYYCWAVMSVILQAVRGPDRNDETKRKILLALAQRMMDKMIAENKLDAEQEVQLYLSILQYQGKYKEALEFLEGPIGTKLYPGAPVELKLDLLKHLSKWKEFNEIIQNLLQNDIDRWDYYQEYINSCIELAKLKDSSPKWEDLESCHEFICSLLESGTKRVRGPFLARLHLHKVMREQGLDANNLLGDFLSLLLEYFQNFGDKTCCAHDIKIFIPYLNEEQYKGFQGKLLEIAPLSDDGSGSKEEMLRYISALQLARSLDTMSREKEFLENLAERLCKLYDAYREKFELNLLSTDIGPCDQLALLGAHVYVDLGIQTKSSAYFLKAVEMLHLLLKNSPSNFHAKLICMKLYYFLGCGSTVDPFLEMKHIQLDSLAYLHSALMPSYFQSFLSTSKSTYQSTIRFFSVSAKDSLEYLAMSYRFGSFSKLQEFMDFRDRLANSYTNHSTKVELALIEIVRMGFAGGSSQSGVPQLKILNINPDQKIDFDAMEDNRDLSVIINWDPKIINEFDKEEVRLKKEQFGLEEVKRNTFKENKITLKIRSTLLSLIVAQVNALTNQHHHVGQGDMDSTTTKEGVSFLTTLKQLNQEWENAFKEAKSCPIVNYNESFLVNLLLSRLNSVLEIPYESTVSSLTSFIIHLLEDSESIEDCNKIGKELQSNLENLTKLAQSRLDEFNQKTDTIFFDRNINQYLVSIQEILSLTILVVFCCLKRFSKSPSASGAGKTSKKGDGNNLDKEKTKIVTDVAKCLKEQFNSLHSILDSLCTKEFDDSLRLLSIDDSFSDRKLTEQKLMLNKMKDSIKDKLKFVMKL